MKKRLFKLHASTQLPMILATPKGEVNAITVAGFLPDGSTKVFLTNHTLKPLSPYSGLPLTRASAQNAGTVVVSEEDVKSAMIVGCCEHCNTDLRASATMAKALMDGQEGLHCVLCGGDVETEIDGDELADALDEEQSLTETADGSSDDPERTPLMAGARRAQAGMDDSSSDGSAEADGEDDMEEADGDDEDGIIENDADSEVVAGARRVRRVKAGDDDGDTLTDDDIQGLLNDSSDGTAEAADDDVIEVEEIQEADDMDDEVVASAQIKKGKRVIATAPKGYLFVQNAGAITLADNNNVTSYRRLKNTAGTVVATAPVGFRLVKADDLEDSSIVEQEAHLFDDESSDGIDNSGPDGAMETAAVRRRKAKAGLDTLDDSSDMAQADGDDAAEEADGEDDSSNPVVAGVRQRRKKAQAGESDVGDELADGDDSSAVEQADDMDDEIACDDGMALSMLHGRDLRQGRVDLVLCDAEDPYYYVMHNKAHVATLQRSRAADELKGLFKDPKFATAASTHIKEHGLDSEGQVRFGAVARTIRLPKQALLRQLVSQSIAKAEKAVNDRMQRQQATYRECLEIAALSLIKGCEADAVNPLRTELTASFKKLGIRSPEGVIDEALAAAYQPFFEQVFKKANELATQPKAAREATARYVNTARFQATASVESSIADSVANRLATGSVRLAASTPQDGNENGVVQPNGDGVRPNAATAGSDQPGQTFSTTRNLLGGLGMTRLRG